MGDIYIVSNLSVGGVESFSYYLAINLGLRNYNVFSVDLGNIKTSDERYLDDTSISKLEEYSYILNFDDFLDRFSSISPEDLLIIPMYARNFLEKLVPAIKMYNNSPKIFGYLHGMGAYYYDNFKEFEPIISKFISVSQSGESELERIFPQRIDDIVFMACPSAISLNENDRKELFHNNRLNIAFIGRMEDSIKGIFRLPLIIDALEKNKIDAKFRIIGSGPDHTELVKRIKQLSLTNIDVEFITNAKSPELIKDYLLKTDVSILLSNFEGAPLVIYEALSFGVIPFSYDVGNAALTIENRVSGMIYNIGEINKIVNDLIFLNSNKEKVKEMSTNALHRISDLGYSYGSYVRKLEELHNTSTKINPKKAIELVEKNKKIKLSNLKKWIRDIIPPEVIHKHYLMHYINFATESTNKESMLLHKAKNETDELKAEYDKLKSFHDSVYTNMPYLWLKLGSLLRRIKF